MASELWQRLRMIRKVTDKRQHEMAKLLGMTRSGYAFHETPHPESRTTPNVDQLRTIAKETGVPLEWIVSDESDVNDLWRMRAGELSAKVALAREVRSRGEQPRAATEDRMRETFWRAVEYQVVATSIGAVDGFDPEEIRPGLKLDYLRGRLAAVFVSSSSAAEALCGAGRLLIVAAVLRCKLDMRLLVWARDGGTISPDLIEAIAAVGVRVFQIGTAEQGGELLLAE